MGSAGLCAVFMHRCPFRRPSLSYQPTRIASAMVCLRAARSRPEMFVADPVPDAHDGPLENGMQALGRVDVSTQASALIIAGEFFSGMIDPEQFWIAFHHGANPMDQVPSR